MSESTELWATHFQMNFMYLTVFNRVANFFGHYNEVMSISKRWHFHRMWTHHYDERLIWWWWMWCVICVLNSLLWYSWFFVCSQSKHFSGNDWMQFKYDHPLNFSKMFWTLDDVVKTRIIYMTSDLTVNTPFQTQ